MNLRAWHKWVIKIAEMLPKVADRRLADTVRFHNLGNCRFVRFTQTHDHLMVCKRVLFHDFHSRSNAILSAGPKTQEQINVSEPHVNFSGDSGGAIPTGTDGATNTVIDHEIQ